MKYIKIIFFICAISTLFSTKMSAQDNKINVSAVVLDAQGNQLPGAVIMSDKDNVSAIANESGEFSIVVSAKSILYVNAIGYKTAKVNVVSGLKSVVLKSAVSDLVQVPFNQVDKTDILGGVSSVNVAKMLDSNYYTYSLDNLGSYIPGYHNNIWGSDSKLVLVDGIPRDEYNVIPAEIEQITVLKSASAVALYGSRAADGVVSITTKRGIAKGNKFNVRVNGGVMVPKQLPKYLGSAQYMTLYNEALTNDNNGVAPSSGLYAQSAIDGTKAGLNPYRYPDVDFYSSKYINQYAKRSEVTAEYTGGNDRARFYVNVGNYNTRNLMNFGNGKNEGENRFNVRGNIDIKLSDVITSKINTSVTFYDNNGSQGSYWSNAATFRPNIVSPLIPISYLNGSKDAATLAYPGSSSFLIDGKYLLGGVSTQTTNPFADMLVRGSTKGTTRKYQFDASLNFNLASVLKGLSFDTQFGIDYNTSYNRQIADNGYAVYSPTWNAAGGQDSIAKLTKIGNDNAVYSQGLSGTYQRQTIFFSGALKYNNTFDKVHNVSGMVLAHGYTLGESAVYHSVANANLGIQASYNYLQKYYIDFTGNVVHSSRLAPGHRDGFSPTVSLGWRLSKETFLADSKVLNDLKLTASAGILNTDLDYTANTGYYWSNLAYSRSGDYFSWQEGRQLQSSISTRGENLDLTFEKKKEISVGLEASLFNNALQLTASYFYNNLTGMPIQATTVYPSFMQNGSTSFVPYINYNADQRSGFDVGVNLNKNIGKVNLNVGLVATYFKTSAYTRSESYQYDYQKRQGKPIDAIFGLRNLGFFKDAADVAASPSQAALGTTKPGDIKYLDVNNDGIIDTKDEVYLGSNGSFGSPLTMGLNITAKWNNFSLFVLANSGTGSYSMKNGSYYWATSGTTAKYSEPMLGRWTPATATTATYPRLTTTSGDNNFRNSDFWLYKNDRINLARIQLSYDIPTKVLKNTFISNLGFFINGNDLLLIAKERVLMETNIGSAPQTRYYSIGVKAVF